MKTFEQFLYEMPMAIRGLPELDDGVADPGPSPQISEFQGHTVHYKDGHFVFREPNGAAAMRIGTRKLKAEPNHHVVAMAEKKAGSKLKYHQALKHLIMHHNLTISSDKEQVPQAQAAWHKLANDPAIDVQHHHEGRKLPLDKTIWSNNYGNSNSRFVAKKRSISESERTPERATKLLRYLAQRRSTSNPWGTKTIRNLAPEYGGVPPLPRGYRWSHAGEHEVDLASIKSNQASVYTDGVESKIRGKSAIRMRGFAHPDGTNYLQDGNHSYHAMRFLGAKRGKMDLHVPRKIDDADV